MDFINFQSTLGIKFDKREPLNKRVKLDIGTLCDCRCFFCYYSDKLKQNKDFEEIKNKIDDLTLFGVDEFDMSGGEPTIHPNWFDILDYCSLKKVKVSTLTNGLKFADYGFLKKSYDKGLREILFSVHGFDEDTHDSIVGKKGAFNKISIALKNACELGIRVRINTTVCSMNLDKLTGIGEFIKPYSIFEINFLPLNYWDKASENEKIDYKSMAREIQKAIKTAEKVPYVNVRYIPYCFMVGYERYVCNTYQHIYDVLDWDIGFYDLEYYKKNRPSFVDDISYLYSVARKNRTATYKKVEDCKQCKYFRICDGFEKALDSIDVYPITGDTISEVNYFRKGFYGRV